MMEHEEVHKNERVCIACDKKFPTEHSTKQHMQSKHHNNSKSSLPVGHPDRYHRKEVVQNKACVKCSKVFATGKETEDHMKEHARANDGFEYPRTEKICRYFRNGFCAKGEQCSFRHIENRIQECRRGQQCIFLAQNRCRFFHQNLGAQKSRVWWGQHRQQKECKFQENCWNLSDCQYIHKEQQGFQFSQQTNRPPKRVRNMRTWINY